MPRAVYRPSGQSRPARLAIRFLVAVALIAGASVHRLHAAELEIYGPEGSGSFGSYVGVLANGNIIVTDPGWDGAKGAAYLYDPDGNLISALHGSVAGDRVGSAGAFRLKNGNYLIRSPYWNNGDVASAGAVTWASGATGVSGEVSASNSLVGSTAFDQIGNILGGASLLALSNGNYVVRNPNWDNGAIVNAGAVTWGDGNAGVTGPVSAANSLVGSSTNDKVGMILQLSDGNYVVRTPTWDDGAVADVGAVTWCNGSTGTSGAVSATNSLIGSHAGDALGLSFYNGVVALADGAYVVVSQQWDDGAVADVGAVTRLDGAPFGGTVSSANSLVGTSAGDAVGSGGVVRLKNGHYVVSSPQWDDGAKPDAGAATWCDGVTGCTGAVASSNSLVGGHAQDRVGSGNVYPLSNGHYVVASPNWGDGQTVGLGAATWRDGSSGAGATVSAANSLTGVRANDRVGSGGDPFAAGDPINAGAVTPLTNGNYVVCSQYWSSATNVAVGAATWVDGSGPTAAAVTPANSLTGDSDNDYVCNGSAAALANGNYVVASNGWHEYGEAQTWGDGASGVVGVVSKNNSLISYSYSAMHTVPLANGNYVARDWGWFDTKTITEQAGAVTWGDGATGVRGEVSGANSLTGFSDFDNVGNSVFPTSDGNYVVYSPYHDNLWWWQTDSGAVTLVRGDEGMTGPVNPYNSVLGFSSNGGTFIDFDYDAARQRLVVGLPYDDYVVSTSLPRVNKLFADQFE